MKLIDMALFKRRSLLGLVVVNVALQLVACASAPAVSGVSVSNPPDSASLTTQWGIQVEGLRLSAAGSMLDFRYRVLDVTKAAPLLDGKTQVFLFDETHGAKLGVPNTPKLGRLRQTSRNNNIMTDRTYFIMFGNPGKALQSGDKVTLLLGQTKISDLIVQ
jgi:hypothetical protein